MLSKLIKRIGEHHLLTQSAAVAFYTTLSLGPFVMIFFLLFSIAKMDMQRQFLLEVSNLLGNSAADVLQSILQSLETNTPSINSIAGWFATLALLVAASGVFAQLRRSLNIIISDNTDKKEDRSVKEVTKDFILNRIFNIGMVLTFIFLSAVSLVLSSILNAMIKMQGEVGLLVAIHTIVSILIFSSLFFLMYHYMPRQAGSKKASLIGAMVTGFLFVFGKELISHLASSAFMVSAYGSAGSLVVLMAWFYFASFILFLGAELVRLYDE